MKFLLGLRVFSQVRIFIRELVEIPHELVKQLLLVVQTLQILQKILLHQGSRLVLGLPIASEASENVAGLILIILGEFLPHLYEHWSKVVFNVVSRESDGLHLVNCSLGQSLKRLGCCLLRATLSVNPLLACY